MQCRKYAINNNAARATQTRMKAHIQRGDRDNCNEIFRFFIQMQRERDPSNASEIDESLKVDKQKFQPTLAHTFLRAKRSLAAIEIEMCTAKVMDSINANPHNGEQNTKTQAFRRFFQLNYSIRCFIHHLSE